MLMMDWHIAPRRHVAVTGGDLVFLDLDAGEYACIPAGEALVRCAGGRLELRLDDPDLAQALAEAGLIRQGPGFAALCDPPVPLRSLGFEPGPANLAQTIRMAGAVLGLAGAFRRRSFAQFVAIARARKRTGTDASNPALRAEVGAFRTLLPWAPRQGQCLYRSFLLLGLLTRAGLDADWVFGVRTWPFAAHCWLQVGDLVLDDDHDHVAGYVPILAA